MAQKESQNNGWTSALINVGPNETISDMFMSFGWEIIDERVPPQSYSDLYNLKALHEKVLLPKEYASESCALHLVTFETQAPPMRSKVSPYQVGGLFDLDIRSCNNQKLSSQMIGEWKCHTNHMLTKWQFGPYQVSEFISIKPEEGLILATMQRFDPPLDREPADLLGSLFNSSIITDNYKLAIDFFLKIFNYNHTLSHELVLDSHPMAKVLEVEHHQDAIMDLSLLYCDGFIGGGIEPIQIRHTNHPQPIEFLQNNLPPHLGLYSLRYEVRDVLSYAEQAKAHPYIKKVVVSGDFVLISTIDSYVLELVEKK